MFLPSKVESENVDQEKRHKTVRLIAQMKTKILNHGQRQTDELASSSLTWTSNSIRLWQSSELRKRRRSVSVCFISLIP